MLKREVCCVISSDYLVGRCRQLDGIGPHLLPFQFNCIRLVMESIYRLHQLKEEVAGGGGRREEEEEEETVTQQ